MRASQKGKVVLGGMEATLPPSSQVDLYLGIARCLGIRDQSVLDSVRLLDYSVLSNMKPSPRDFSDRDEYFRHAQFAALFRKRSDVGSDESRELTALKTYIDAELRCRESNVLLRAWYTGSGTNYVPPLFSASLLAARKIVYSVLGTAPDFTALPIRFGPGATTQVKRNEANLRNKLSQGFACSESMLPYIREVIESMPDFVFRDSGSGESASVCVEIHPSRLSFVPKSFSTFRSIAVEPWLNSIFQLGAGAVIAKRLKKTVGIDIHDQSRNQEASRRASIDQSEATIDLSSASDTICFELVRLLLPPDWFALLLALRSSTVSYRGIISRVEKFSSMGNGFTFPLQTLIFYALVRACTEEGNHDSSRILAYGDDIVCPTEAFDSVAAFLRWVGFIVNVDKSFSDGPFRESCGKDYWQGIDVRPVFLKRNPDFFDLFALHNGFVRMGREDLADIVFRHIPGHLVLLGPDGYGDGHLIREFEKATLNKKLLSRGWRGYTFDTYSRRARRFTRPRPGDYLYPSYSIYVFDGEGSPNALPGFRGYKRLSIYTLA